MSYTNKQILDILRKVKHPEKQKDIVSLGMVDDIKISGNKISFNLLFKKANDPFISSIRKACVQAIENNLGEEAEIKGNISVKVPEKEDNKAQEEEQIVFNSLYTCFSYGRDERIISLFE